MKLMRFLYCAVIVAAIGSKSDAALIDAPLPTNAYITQSGLDWAWANPLPSNYYLDLSYQSQFGWRLPTAEELAFAPLATDFLIAGGNVPFGGVDPISGATFSALNSAYTDAGSAAAIAVPYFSTVFYHADWQDGLGQPYGPWAGMPGAFSFADQLVVRVSGNVVPEPSSLITAALAGVVGLGVWGRRRRLV